MPRVIVGLDKIKVVPIRAVHIHLYFQSGNQVTAVSCRNSIGFFQDAANIPDINSIVDIEANVLEDLVCQFFFSGCVRHFNVFYSIVGCTIQASEMGFFQGM